MKYDRTVAKIMNIVVCIKQVPDAVGIRIDRKRMTIIREGVESVINPLDYVALEAALILREKLGGSVTILTMGPLQSEAALRETLAMGANRALLLSDAAFAGADTLATSLVLAAAIKRLDPFPDLILCGKHTTDSDTGHVGPQLAEGLDLPQACGVHDIHPQDDALLVKRVSDGFEETLKVPLPALLTVTHDFCAVRDLPLGDLETAFSRKTVTRWGLQDLGLAASEVGLTGSATQVRTLHPPPPREGGKRLEGSPEELVDGLIRKLEDMSILDEES